MAKSMPEATKKNLKGWCRTGLTPGIEPASLLEYIKIVNGALFGRLFNPRRTARFSGDGSLVSPRSGFPRRRRNLYSGNGPHVFSSGDGPLVSAGITVTIIVANRTRSALQCSISCACVAGTHASASDKEVKGLRDYLGSSLHLLSWVIGV